MAGTLVVTGGSRGLGAASAIMAAKRLGFAVAVNYRSEKAKAEQVVAKIEADGGKAVAIQGDTGVEADIVHLFKEAEDKLGPITGLVNNAGILGDIGRVDQTTAAGLAHLWAVNITGCFIAAREAVKRMSTLHGGKGGVIVEDERDTRGTTEGQQLLRDAADRIGLVPLRAELEKIRSARQQCGRHPFRVLRSDVAEIEDAIEERGAGIGRVELRAASHGFAVF